MSDNQLDKYSTHINESGLSATNKSFSARNPVLNFII